MQGKQIAAWTTVTIIIVALFVLLLVSVGVSYFFYQKVALLEKEKKKIQTEVDTLKKEVQSLRQQLKTGGGEEEIILGNTPEEVVEVELKRAGIEVGYEAGKYVISLRSVNEKEAVVWVGPFASEFITEFQLEKFQGKWQIIDRRGLEP